jgi:hypothetical protein
MNSFLLVSTGSRGQIQTPGYSTFLTLGRWIIAWRMSPEFAMNNKAASMKLFLLEPSKNHLLMFVDETTFVLACVAMV